LRWGVEKDERETQWKKLFWICVRVTMHKGRTRGEGFLVDGKGVAEIRDESSQGETEEDSQVETEDESSWKTEDESSEAETEDESSQAVR